MDEPARFLETQEIRSNRSKIKLVMELLISVASNRAVFGNHLATRMSSFENFRALIALVYSNETSFERLEIFLEPRRAFRESRCVRISTGRNTQSWLQGETWGRIKAARVSSPAASIPRVKLA